MARKKTYMPTQLWTESQSEILHEKEMILQSKGLTTIASSPELFYGWGLRDIDFYAKERHKSQDRNGFSKFLRYISKKDE